MRKHLLRISLILFQGFSILAQSPTDLTSNVNLPNSNVYTNSTSGAPTFSSTAQVVASFNYGRRQEEIQLGLAANALGDLVLPASFGSLTPAQQALYIINEERKARAGQNYPGSSGVSGLPLEGLETNLSSVAQGHATDMITNGFFGHTGTDGKDPVQRIAANSVYSGACRNDLFAYSENIYSSCTYSSTAPIPGNPPPAVPFLTAQAIYSWVYRDSGASWGHRRAILIQDADIYPHAGVSGYVNDRGSAISEGFLGIGVASVVGWGGCGSIPGFFNTGGNVVVLNVVDPSNEVGCNFNIEQDPLPVTLLSFQGKSEEQKIKLFWSTTRENSNAGFEIHKSLDARTWRKIGFVEAKGNFSKQQNQYDFTDMEIAPLTDVYYRLGQVDSDGKKEFSRILIVKSGDTNNLFYIYPNPTVGQEINVYYSDPSKVSFELMNLKGESVPVDTFLKTGQEGVKISPKNNLVSGTYFIKLRDSMSSKSWVKKFIVE